MRSAFTRCGRVSFARGNTTWAKSFNRNLSAARTSGSLSGPYVWRQLSPGILKLSAAFSTIASEVPYGQGFAEQRGCSQFVTLVSNMSSSDSDDALSLGDEVAELTTACGTRSLATSNTIDLVITGLRHCTMVNLGGCALQKS